MTRLVQRLTLFRVLVAETQGSAPQVLATQWQEYEALTALVKALREKQGQQLQHPLVAGRTACKHCAPISPVNSAGC